ncbi:MAG: 50S ribosomal protein L10, partial [Acidimicrobiaceae bacterium]|nr:50S ribosomal protein L10 [Acidimicrobiaceae bacterium]
MSQEQRAEKSAVIDDVRERFDEAEAVLVTEYRGLDVSQMADLRRALRETETVYKIYKNTLVRRALDEGTPEGLVDMLVGPTALAFVENDPGAAAKALKEFSAANEALIIKGGLLNGDLLDEAQVRELADLPSREELLSSIAGGLAAPLQQIASMMNNLLSEMANLLQALADKGDASAEAPVEEPVVEEPVVEEPVVEEPVAEEPVVEEASVEEPVVEEPVV